MLPFRSRPTEDCDEFITELSADLQEIRRSTWLAQPADNDLRARRSVVVAGAEMILAGQVSYSGTCGDMLDAGFSLPGAAQPRSGGGCADAFVESQTGELSRTLALPGAHCGNSLTTNCGAAIPDSSPFNNWLDSHKAVLGCGFVRGIKVGLDIHHGLVGDLSVTLVAPDGTQRTLLDRAGMPSRGPEGCVSENVRITFSDDARLQAELTCDDSPPLSHAILGEYRPIQALGALVGKPADGAWRIRIVDGAGLNSGILQDWSLDLDCSSAPLPIADLRAVTTDLVAPGPGNTIVPGMPFQWTTRVRNSGPSAVANARFEADFRGNFQDVSFTCQTLSNASCASAVGAGDLVEAGLDLGVNGEAEISIQATPNASLDSPALEGFGRVYRPAALGDIGLDPSPTNDHAHWSGVTSRVADLAVQSLTSQASVVAGDLVALQVKASNNGPSRIATAQLQVTEIENLSVVSLSCVPEERATTSAASGASPLKEVQVMLAPDPQGSVLCDAVVQVPPSAQPGMMARVSISVSGSQHVETMPTDNAFDQSFIVVTPNLFADGFD
jgi:subtilisin-like proprotein convertase family protein